MAESRGAGGNIIPVSLRLLIWITERNGYYQGFERRFEAIRWRLRGNASGMGSLTARFRTCQLSIPPVP